MPFKFWKRSYDERRGRQRHQTHLLIEISSNSSVHNALITNISESGLYFITEQNLSPGEKIEILIKKDDSCLKVPVTVNRMVKTGTLYDAFAAEPFTESKDYINFVRGLNSN